MPPQIIPFDFGTDPVDAGDMSTVQCAVNKGDMPVEITWSLNEQLISQKSIEGIVITRINKKVSSLSIDNVKAVHRGNYVCSVKNTAGTANHSAILDVNGRFKSLSCVKCSLVF